jgi:hypothetical protein
LDSREECWRCFAQQQEVFSVRAVHAAGRMSLQPLSQHYQPGATSSAIHPPVLLLTLLLALRLVLWCSVRCGEQAKQVASLFQCLPHRCINLKKAEHGGGGGKGEVRLGSVYVQSTCLFHHFSIPHLFFITICVQPAFALCSQQHQPGAAQRSRRYRDRWIMQSERSNSVLGSVSIVSVFPPMSAQPALSSCSK